MNISPRDFMEGIRSGERFPPGLVVDDCMASVLLNKKYFTTNASLPEDLTINGDLLLLDTDHPLVNIPKGLVVKGNLNIRGCTSLLSISEGLVVGGYLAIVRCSRLTSLPGGTVIKKELILKDTCSFHLPFDITVGGTIYCDHSLIDEIKLEDLPLYINFNFDRDFSEYISQRLKR
jgi:hypothetical protein